MLDFTSALYLGFRHSNPPLASWTALTLGRPAALEEPPGADEVAAGLARMQGCEAATLMPSTLHLFWDMFELLSRDETAVLLDSSTYPVARWGVLHASARGATVQTFCRHDVCALKRLIDSSVRAGRRPVVVVDGYCAACGDGAPLNAYAALAAKCGGTLVIDDTQALGILGHLPTPAMPYGYGGGGSLRWQKANGPHIIVGASLAKALGAPLAVISGSNALINRFREQSGTRIHCSPPSVAAIAAARQALRCNFSQGDPLRGRLLGLVLRMRALFQRAGLQSFGCIPFPVQHFCPPNGYSAVDLHHRLLGHGIRSVITRTISGGGHRLTFLVSARHRVAEIDLAGRIVGDIVAGCGPALLV